MKERPRIATALGAALSDRIDDVIARVPWEEMASADTASSVESRDLEERWSAARRVAETMAAALLGDAMSYEEDLLLARLGRQSARRRLPVALLMQLLVWLTEAAISVCEEEAEKLGIAVADAWEVIRLLQTSSNRLIVSVAGHFDSELDTAQEELAFLAHHDSLTGLANRCLALEKLGMTPASGGPAAAATVVYFIDIDRFKAINDRLGHQAGDESLAVVAARIRNILRPGDLLSRFGGDEFVALCWNVPSQKVARRIGERIVATIGEGLVAGGQPVMLTASVGIAIGEPAEAPEHLIARADAAMYEVKRRGGNGSRLAGSEPTATGIDVVFAAELREALERRQLELHFQTIVDPSGCDVLGHEALLRWNHPTRGLVGPTEFIPIAETTGLIVALGNWVIEEATRQSVAHFGTGRDAPILTVNVSVRQLAHPSLLPRVKDALRSSGLPPGRLVVEVTETMLATFPECEAALQNLKNLGVSLAIDDFGTGYSSLSYLQHLPVSWIKIDRSFVSELSRATTSGAVVAGMVNLAHNLGLRVIAEGIETKDQADALRVAGCDALQGFYFAKPAPLAAEQPIVPGLDALAG